METKFKHGAVVKTTKKVTIDDPLVEGIFIRGRKKTTDSIIDSPIHFKYNKLWLVKHSNSRLVRGISVGFYGVYHESELELVDMSTPPLIDEDDD